MPRAAGQIDRAKNEAILQAASEVLAERGLSAPMALIARRAKVSKQTIYNHYGAKMDLIRALVARRVATVTTPLDAPDAHIRPEDALAGFARALLGIVVAPNGYALIRLCIQSANEAPDLGRDVFALGPLKTLGKLAEFMQLEMDKGSLAAGDAMEAAEYFAGMAVGHKQVAALLGLQPSMDEATLNRRSREVAVRFMRAYAP